MENKLEILPFNDVLNDDIAHFFKSGTIRRSDKNDKLDSSPILSGISPMS